MLLQAKEVEVQSSGMMDTVKFRANLDGMMFDNLINGIYSNKIGAGIREYATNARDGHARQGNLNQPFDVGLPNRDKAYFEVRDYGSSLTHDEVFNVYAVLGESTKRETNDETGCLGLGSKSAFAYTNMFTVTCWKDGEKRDYSCYIGANGQPLVSLISKVPSNEKQGIRVSYPVKHGDIEAFNKEAAVQLAGFDPQPNIIRKTDAYNPISDNEILVQGDGWKIYKKGTDSYSYNTKAFATQGSVAYPINTSNQSLSDALGYNSVGKPLTTLLRSCNIIMNFPIGELTMTTSREELAYDEKTCSNIAKRVNDVYKDISKELDKEYQTLNSMEEARIFMSKANEDGRQDLERLLGLTDRKWRGIKIKPIVHFGEQDGDIGEYVSTKYQIKSYYSSTPVINALEPTRVKGTMRIIEQYDYRNKFGEYKAQFKYPAANGKNTVMRCSITAHKVRDLKVVIQVEDQLVDKKLNLLMRDIWKNKLVNGERSFIWVVVETIADAKKFLKTILHDEPKNVFWVHEATELKAAKKAKGSIVNPTNDKERKLRVITGKRWAYASDAAKYETVDLTKTSGKLPVVFFKNGAFYMSQSDMENDIIGYKYKDLAPRIAEWDTTEQLYVINQPAMSWYKDNKSSFCEALPVLVKAWKGNNKGWEEIYAKSKWLSDDSENKAQANVLLNARNIHGVEFKVIKKDLDKYEIEKLANSSKKSNSYVKVPLTFGDPLAAEKEAAEKKWPNPKQSSNVFSDFVNGDPVLKYLLKTIGYYHVDDELIKVIKLYAADKQYN